MPCSWRSDPSAENIVEFDNVEQFENEFESERAVIRSLPKPDYQHAVNGRVWPPTHHPVPVLWGVVVPLIARRHLQTRYRTTTEFLLCNTEIQSDN